MILYLSFLIIFRFSWFCVEVYSFSENDEKEKENKKILESLEINDELDIDSVNTEQKFTQPPARYNQVFA